MKLIGHTMATPMHEIKEAIDLFSELGLNGTEVISRNTAECGDKHGAPGGEARIFNYEWDQTEILDTVKYADNKNVSFLTVTQYQKAFNSTDEAERAEIVEKISTYMDFAKNIGAKYVRVYGGADGFGVESWPFMVESLKELARRAEVFNLVLLIENHPGTLTVTGEQTAKLVNDVASHTVKALYDPANVLAHSDEDWERTIDVQKGMIEYVHIKDFSMQNGRRLACPVGKGDVPWDKIMPKLVAGGYNGPLSFEYEKKWNPEQLPDAEEGLPICINYIKSCL